MLTHYSRVFGNEEGKMIIKGTDNREREAWQKFVRRKEERKAGTSAAAADDTINTAALSGK
jgi:hypothetical protein